MLLTGLGATGCATGLTGDPARVDHDAVIVSGQVVADTAGTVEYWAEYGLTDAYGSESQHLTIAVQKNAPATVGVQLTGLARSTPYHYRLCARDSSQKGGPGCGADRSVRTQSVACGETVTTDVRLTGDLDCRGAPVLSPGLAVGAAGIDINLGGFKILGPVNSGGGGAQDGIDIKGGEANAVRRSSATGRIGGIVVSQSNVAIVANNSATGNFANGLSFDG